VLSLSVSGAAAARTRPSCAEGGVLGVLPGHDWHHSRRPNREADTWGIGEPLIGRFLIYDALRMKVRELKLRRIRLPGLRNASTVTKLNRLRTVLPAFTPAARSRSK